MLYIFEINFLSKKLSAEPHRDKKILMMIVQFKSRDQSDFHKIATLKICNQPSKVIIKWKKFTVLFCLSKLGQIIVIYWSWKLMIKIELLSLNKTTAMYVALFHEVISFEQWNTYSWKKGLLNTFLHIHVRVCAIMCIYICVYIYIYNIYRMHFEIFSIFICYNKHKVRYQKQKQVKNKQNFSK